jgi:hypothetical protein
MRPAITSMISRLLTVMLWSADGDRLAKADPLPDPPPQVLADPSPLESTNFPPALATAGTADPSRELAVVKPTNAHERGCTALNPCAEPPPSLQSIGPLAARLPAALHPE